MSVDSKLVTFLRRKDYVLVKELGQGACGRTVLLNDEVLNQYFVCKKYAPLQGLDRATLFQNFVREIKLLHDLHHVNVLRVFNYYLYPETFSGFILMEYVQGDDLPSYLKRNPEQTNEIFLQVIQGFQHLESKSVLHRDIRPANLMVTDDGIVKIIDLGFGKRVESSVDFDKSISLNLWCEPPAEFHTSTYDFCTEVYFVAKLFEQILLQENIQHFKYLEILNRMAARKPEHRIASFSEVERAIHSDLFYEINFSEDELMAYRVFADEITERLTKMESSVKYADDLERIRAGLQSVVRTVALETYMPDSAPLMRCLLVGQYYYRKDGFPVRVLKQFLKLLQTVSIEKQRIVLANLHSRFDSINRYTKRQVPSPFDDMDDDIPF